MAKNKKSAWSYSAFSNSSAEWIIKNLPFILFLGFLATIYIANAHYAEKTVREIQTTQKDLKELRWYYMSLRSENMVNSKQSEVAKRVKDEGLRIHYGNKKIIEID